mgnify:CR=1 FL=1
MSLSSIFFFFQAEDGIRDLVRSRGLGDVYKRQHQHRAGARSAFAGRPRDTWLFRHTRTAGPALALDRAAAVSYTHLTLPTSDLV